MQDFQQRVLDEKKDLDNKIKKLFIFITTSQVYLKLNSVEKNNLCLQLNTMRCYSDILHNRIKNWKNYDN